MKTEVFSTVACLVFGIQSILFLRMLVRNARSIMKIPLYVDFRGRMSAGWKLVPVLTLALTGIGAMCVTGYHFTSMLMAVVLLPVLYGHVMVSPSAVRSVADIEDMRNEAFRKVIARGMRSRVLTVCLCLNLLMMCCAFFSL